MIGSNETGNSQDDDFKAFQSIFLTARRVQLSIGCVVLMFIICSICYSNYIVNKEKQFVYNTTKSFMFSSLCYFIGMLIVLLHQESFTANNKYYYDKDFNQTFAKGPYLQDVFKDMGDRNRIYCGLEAFVNLFSYNLGYFFAVLITYNVHCVIYGNYRNFMKNVFKKIQVQLLLIIMLILHAIPLLFSITYPNSFHTSHYCFGPAGFKFAISNNIQANLIFFCGLTSNNQSFLWIFGIVNVYILPTILFCYHSVLFCLNRRKIQQITQITQSYLSQKQHFLIHSGKISFVVFLIQGVNLGKSLFFILNRVQSLNILNIIINYLFDLYPFIILIFYIKYNKQKKKKQGKNSIITISSNQALIQYQDKISKNNQSFQSIQSN